MLKEFSYLIGIIPQKGTAVPFKEACNRLVFMHMHGCYGKNSGLHFVTNKVLKKM
jgi:hypothetical protein